MSTVELTQPPISLGGSTILPELEDVTPVMGERTEEGSLTETGGPVPSSHDSDLAAPPLQALLPPILVHEPIPFVHPLPGTRNHWADSQSMGADFGERLQHRDSMLLTIASIEATKPD